MMKMLMSIVFVVLLCMFFVSLSWVNAAPVYVCTDDKGSASLQDVPCAAGTREAHRYDSRALTNRSYGWDNQYQHKPGQVPTYRYGHGQPPVQHVIVQDEIVVRDNPSTRPRHERGTLNYSQRLRLRQLERDKDQAIRRGGWVGRQEVRDLNREIRQIYRTAED